ncbi:MAG: UDP-glucose/GDP-mannose dehydrogenase family protein [Actinobacteria bacterium]|nr:MAG: UDP-glucose/GDP-mannose dehydrogenase family protein [Actinomycetota bacterium]
MSTAGEREPIAVIGAGYVGLVSAAGFAELGSEVWCVDIDAAKIERLRAGEVPIHEPGVQELLRRNAGTLHFSTDLAGALEHARLLFVAVGTPPTYSGDADLSAVHAVVEAIPPSEEHALVMKSTVPCGTGAALQRSFRERGKGGLGYVSCPEFLREGSAVHDFMHPDRVVVGIDEHDSWAGDAVVELYASLGVPLVRTDIASAEMVKLASNAFLATKISFINEIANVCEETGADVVEVARGMGLDTRIGPRFLHAGIGYGGSCFPKDVDALKQLAGNSGYHFQLLTAVIEVNELQKRRVIAKLHKHLGGLAGRRVALFGLAFKPETDDMRDASSLVLAARLNADGARVVAYDPVAEEQARRMVSGIEFAGSALEAAGDADAVVLVTEWPEFQTLDWGLVAERMRGVLVIDGRNALDPDAVRAAGLTYEGVGRSAQRRAGEREPDARVPGGSR